MFVVSGATGRVGSGVADHLLTAGAPVRVLVRRAETVTQWEAKGAEVAVTDLRDSEKLRTALDGAQAFFAMMPFDLTVADLDAYADEVATSVATAVAASGVPHTVMLSSGGADLAEGTGPIRGLHVMEQQLLGTSTTLTALRSGHFQEKLGDVMDAASNEGVFPVFSRTADEPVPMVATRDVAQVAAEALLAGATTSEAVDIVGPAYTEREVAEALGAELGRDLTVITVPAASWTDALTEAGFDRHIAESLSELYHAYDDGKLDPRGDRSVTVTTPLTETIRRMLA